MRLTLSDVASHNAASAAGCALSPFAPVTLPKAGVSHERETKAVDMSGGAHVGFPQLPLEEN